MGFVHGGEIMVSHLSDLKPLHSPDYRRSFEFISQLAAKNTPKLKIIGTW